MLGKIAPMDEHVNEAQCPDGRTAPRTGARRHEEKHWSELWVETIVCSHWDLKASSVPEPDQASGKLYINRAAVECFEAVQACRACAGDGGPHPAGRRERLGKTLADESNAQEARAPLPPAVLRVRYRRG